MCSLTFDDLFAHKIYHHTYQDQLINFFSFFLSLKNKSSWPIFNQFLTMKEIVPILIKNEATTRIHFPNEIFFNNIYYFDKVYGIRKVVIFIERSGC